jgi:Domain of unknown function (DUF5615)
MASLTIPFFTDENVADSVGNEILSAGHSLIRLRDVMVTGSTDRVVAVNCRENGLVLVSHNYRDFRKLSQDFGLTRGQMDALHRVDLGCNEVAAAQRFREAMSLIEHEWAWRRTRGGGAMVVFVGDKVIRTHR